MKHRRIPMIVIAVLVVVIAGYYGVRALTASQRQSAESLRHDRNRDGEHLAGTGRQGAGGARWRRARA